MGLSACPGCGIVLPEHDGPVHAYIESSPACWAMYGAVLAREYSRRDYWPSHRLTVDAYAAQHPGPPPDVAGEREARRSIQSVAVHLIALHLVLERHVPLEGVTGLLGAAVNRGGFVWLEPPAVPAGVAVGHVWEATTAEGHAHAVREWAEAVWRSWVHHHDVIRKWAGDAVAPSNRS